jgi:Copper transport outer membrane protein, MctB
VIDFRYHLVSIVAIFLALAVGLVVGATSLSGPVETALKKAEQRVSTENKSLESQNKALGHQLSADQQFAQAGSQRLLGGLLTGQKVVLVVAPSAASGMTSGVSAALRQAGASVTGEVLLQPSFLDASGRTESSLTQLATQFAPQAGVSLPGNPLYTAVAGQQSAAAVIAASVVTKTGTGLGNSADSAILSGFAQAGFLQVYNPAKSGVAALEPATLAVLLTPAGSQSQSANDALVAVAAELRSASLGTVMAGSLSAIGPGSAISLEGSSGPVSTVDYADTVTGQIIVAQALWELLDGKAPTAYGVGPGTAPSPAPTPAASSTTTTTSNRAGT